MKKTILEIYALAICFVTVGCFIITLGIAIYDSIGIIYPEFTLNSFVYYRHLSNESFWETREHDRYDKEKIKPRPEEDVLTKLRLESYKEAIIREKKSAIQTLTRCIIILIITSIVFIIHWRLARRARESNNSAQTARLISDNS